MKDHVGWCLVVIPGVLADSNYSQQGICGSLRLTTQISILYLIQGPTEGNAQNLHVRGELDWK